MTPEIRRLLDVQQRMMDFATTKPSPQQTRQKSAREMVETFAYDLKDALAALLALPADLPPPEDWRRIYGICENHMPDRWEGDGSCIICEGQRLWDQLHVTARPSPVDPEAPP